MRRVMDRRSWWLTTAVSLLASLIAVGLLVGAVVSARERGQALTLAEGTLAELERVRAESEQERAELLTRIDELTVQVEQLQDVVRELGGDPTVVIVPEPTSDTPPEPAGAPQTSGQPSAPAPPVSRQQRPGGSAPAPSRPAPSPAPPSPPPPSAPPSPAPSPPAPDEPGLLEGTAGAVCTVPLVGDVLCP